MPAWTWSLLALAFGVGISLWAADIQRERALVLRNASLRHVAESAHAALVDRLEACELLVRSVQTIFLASEGVSPQEFANAYTNLRPRKTFPSLQAMVFARLSRRDDGVHYISELVAPMAGNERVLGLDVRTQPENFAAAERARDTDRPMLSAPFRLVQLSQQEGAVDGVTLRLPVYGPGAPPRNVAERRARTLGSLAMSFRIGRLIETALPPEAKTRLHVTVEDISDGVPLRLYDSHDIGHLDAGGYRFRRDLGYGGRVWRLSMHPLGAADAGIDWRESILLPGLAASLLLALLVWSVATTRRRALELGWQMSRRYRESEERFRSLTELMPALVLLARADDGLIDYANQAARERLGAHVADGARLDDLFEDGQVRQAQGSLVDDGSWRNIEAVMRSTNGDRFWASTSISQVEVEDQRKLLMVAKDISEQRQLTELLSYQATHDALTDLYNRREFERHVERALLAVGKGAAPCALLYIDLDQFKLINDTSGHLAGDQLLGQLALAMAEQLRGGDILARLGGDEFGILAHDSHPEGARILAERVRECIEGYIYVWNQRSYSVSASIGVVMIDRPGQTLGGVLAHADSACYMAKDHGRNRIHFYSEQDDETIKRRGEMEWANRLRWVIDEQRLLLDYQEVRPLRPVPGEAPHIELLLRLRDEEGRVVLPGAFLPAAERYGLLGALDRWVLGEAISHFDVLHPAGRPARCSVNISASSLEDEALVDDVIALIERHGVPPGSLCFEITETEAVRNLARAVRFIERLRAAGCQVALDDFGAGMSSFGYLKNLPVDVIKIDGSFIRDLESDPMSRSIVEVIAEIGHQRGLDVVAEWVEDVTTLEMLRKLGVDYAQGFGLHRPERVVYQREAAKRPEP